MKTPHDEDPPMERLLGTVWWLESASAPIANDPDTAVLIIRLQLALNAIESQARGAVHIAELRAQSRVEWMRQLIVALIIHGSLVKEAVNILSGTSKYAGQMQRVSDLAAIDGAPKELDTTIRQLCGGSHPASVVLNTLRNKLGFHWDPDVLRDSLIQFVPNRTLVWAEAPEIPPNALVFRLAMDVAANVLFPSAHSAITEPEREHSRITEALDAVDSAGNSIIAFFSHAVRAYFKQIGVEKKTK